MFNQKYLEQVKLLLDIIPLIDKYPDFALKGGTAINFFLLKTPRLSIDIDLCFLPVLSRKESFDRINKNIKNLKILLQKHFKNTAISMSKSPRSKILKLLVSNQLGVVKIEPNQIIRGSVLEPVRKRLNTEISTLFNTYPEAQILSPEDLFAGKICAALDRQHPRDLFDIHMMFQKRMFSRRLKKVFLIYLIQHNRPMAELLQPNMLNLESLFNDEFKGMVRQNISLEQIYKTRDKLVQKLMRTLTTREREFLISVKKESPDWDLLGLGNFSHLPGVQWKLHNISAMTNNKKQSAIKKLEFILFHS